jgi:hypothetical protein
MESAMVTVARCSLEIQLFDKDISRRYQAGTRSTQT